MRWLKTNMQALPDERGHTARPDERGHTAIEAAVAAALLGAVLVPLVAFASYLALEKRAEAYAEAVRLAERYAETAEAGAFEAAASDSLNVTARERRFSIERTASVTGSILRVRVTVRRTRTGRTLTTLERSFFLPRGAETAMP